MGLPVLTDDISEAELVRRMNEELANMILLTLLHRMSPAPGGAAGRGSVHCPEPWLARPPAPDRCDAGDGASFVATGLHKERMRGDEVHP